MFMTLSSMEVSSYIKGIPGFNLLIWDKIDILKTNVGQTSSARMKSVAHVCDIPAGGIWAGDACTVMCRGQAVRGINFRK